MRGIVFLAIALLVSAVVAASVLVARRHQPSRETEVAHAVPLSTEPPSPSRSAMRESLSTARPDIDPVRLTGLRVLGARVLDAFEMRWSAGGAMLRAAESLDVPGRIAEAISPGRVDLHLLRKLGAALSGHEEELLAAARGQPDVNDHAGILALLNELDTAAARRAGVELVRWDLARMDSEPPTTSGLLSLQRLVRSCPTEGAEALLPGARSIVELARDESEVSARRHTLERLHVDLVSRVARSDSPDAVRAVRALLESPDERVRAVAADGVLAALAESSECALAAELRDWAAAVSRGSESALGLPRLAWLVHAGEGASALDTLMGVQIPANDSWDEWFADYRAWVRAVVRAAERAQPAAARRALKRLLEEVPPGVAGLSCDELDLASHALARVGADEDFELLCRLASTNVSRAYSLLDRAPRWLWKGHERDLRELLAELGRDMETNGALVRLGMTALVRIGGDPRALSDGSDEMEQAIREAIDDGAPLRARDELAARTEETAALAPIERIRVLAAEFAHIRAVRRELVDAITAIAEEAVASSGAPELESALLDPALPLAEARVPLLSALAAGARPDRAALLGRVLPALMERDCPGSAWPTLQAAASLAVLEGREGRVAASEVLVLWERCRPRVSSRRASGPVELLREFLREAEALGVERVYDG